MAEEFISSNKTELAAGILPPSTLQGSSGSKLHVWNTQSRGGIERQGCSFSI